MGIHPHDDIHFLIRIDFQGTCFEVVINKSMFGFIRGIHPSHALRDSAGPWGPDWSLEFLMVIIKLLGEGKGDTVVPCWGIKLQPRKMAVRSVFRVGYPVHSLSSVIAVEGLCRGNIPGWIPVNINSHLGRVRIDGAGALVVLWASFPVIEPESGPPIPVPFAVQSGFPRIVCQVRTFGIPVFCGSTG